MTLRILHISTRLILGGSQENTVLSCEGQARLGHDVHLAFGPIYGPEGSMLDRVRAFHTADARSITTHELPNMVREIHPIKDHYCFHRDLKTLMREVRPDVVHTHSSKAGILGRVAAWKSRTASKRTGARPAVVHTIHGPPFMPVDGSKHAQLMVRAKNAAYTHAERYAARHCDVIVSVADAMTEQFLARRIGLPEQYVTVRSGMETEPFLHASPGEDRASVRAELGLAPDDFVIGTVARLAEHKGHDDVLTGLADDLHRNPAWKLLWVGDGWWRDRLMARVGSLGLDGQVVCTGLVPSERIPAMMRAMDVLCHPSYREGLPRTVPQALLCGVPVVATDADGTREACIDGQTGRLVPVGDAEALGDAVRWMAEHPAERTRMGEQGRERCRVEFSTQTMVDRLEEVYADAITRATQR